MPGVPPTPLSPPGADGWVIGSGQVSEGTVVGHREFRAAVNAKQNTSSLKDKHGERTSRRAIGIRIYRGVTDLYPS